MEIIKNDEYDSIKKSFFSKHQNDYTIDTTGYNAEYYTKTYVFEDGAIWYDVMRKKYVSTTVNTKYGDFLIDLELLETEFWNSENSESKFYYEKWDY